MQLRQNHGICALANRRLPSQYYALMTDIYDPDQNSNIVRFANKTPKLIRFDLRELSLIMRLYGRYVAEGEWRDYAIDFSPEAATFAIHRRASEQPLYRITKNPTLAQKQGQYAVIAPGGLILKRGQDLEQVLRVLVKKPKLVDA